MANRNIHVILDRELYAGVEMHAAKLYAGMSHGRQNLSASIRDLLRQALRIVADGYDAGWREGYSAAYSEAQNRLASSLSEMSPTGERSIKSK